METLPFFAHMKNIILLSTTLSFTAADDITVFSQKAIEKEILGFYKGLLDKASEQWPSVNTRIMKDDPELNRKQQLHFIKLVSREEIVQFSLFFSSHCL